ncbi:MAG: low temperature requirement protein A [Pyrinomonadaceae bacterium]
MILPISVMVARDPNEPHRTATPLELFFDLVYVVAVASAASQFHHAIANHHLVSGFLSFSLAFFAIWLAWINYTWFASAYDTRDTLFRVFSFIQIFGSLVFAVGIPDFFREHPSYATGILGYVIMRIGLILQWLRAAQGDEKRRNTCYRYALSLTLIQFFWVAALFVPSRFEPFAIVSLVVLECLIAPFAESYRSTSWHPHHIAERYGLFVIIVLGEGILGTTNALSGVHEANGTWTLEMLLFGFGTAALIFLLWGTYFKLPFGRFLEGKRTNQTAYAFGYAHFFVFAALTCVGVGLELVADNLQSGEDPKHVASPLFTILFLSTAIGIYLLTIAILRFLLFKQSNCNGLVFLNALFTPVVPVLAVYFGISLPVGVMLSMLAPAIYIALTNLDGKAA